jgi:hypothetical protein
MRLLFSVSVVIFALHLIEPPIYGQVWVPRKRTGTVSIIYKNLYVHDHTTNTGKRVDSGQIRQNVVSVNVDYGLTRRAAAYIELPFVFAKYDGAVPHVDPELPSIDDGVYHGGAQDFRVGFRYNVARYGPVTVTPFVEGIIPSRNYPIFGHAMIGRNLHELIVGTYLSPDLESLLPRASFETRMSFAFVERVENMSHNRTNVAADFSYLLTDRLVASGVASFQLHHGGLEVKSSITDYSDEEWHMHGQLFRNNSLDVGGGATFFVNSSTSISALLITTPWSRNAHALKTGVIIGVTRRFQTRKPRPPLSE